MTNNLRTLLLNLPMDPAIAGHPFAQFIDPAFTPVQLDGAHSWLRDLVLGKNPDRLYAEFVATQMYRMAWVDPDCRHVTETLDPRSTINPFAGHLRWTAPDVTIWNTTGPSPAAINMTGPSAGKNPLDEFVLYTPGYSDIDAGKFLETGVAASLPGVTLTDPVIRGYSRWTGPMGEISKAPSAPLTVFPMEWFSLSFPESSGGGYPEFMVSVSASNLPALDVTAIANSMDWGKAATLATLPGNHKYFKEGSILLGLISSSSSLATRLSATICAYQLSLSQ